MVRKTQRGADGHEQGSRSDGHAGLLRVDGVVGGGVATGRDGLLVEKMTWWPALGRTQNACAVFFPTSLSFLIERPLQVGLWFVRDMQPSSL